MAYFSNMCIYHNLSNQSARNGPLDPFKYFAITNATILLTGTQVQNNFVSSFAIV